MRKKVYFMLLMVIINSCSSSEWTKELTTRLFGESIYLSNILAKYNSESIFSINLNGDGYRIYVFKLSEEYVEKIMENFIEIQMKYPQKPDYRDKWESVGWQKSPIKENEKIFYDFIVGNEDHYFYISGHFQRAIKYFINAMNTEGNFYCYNYNLHKYSDEMIRVGDIDFYIFCPKEKILICINQNT
jgi:hypothetical protein